MQRDGIGDLASDRRDADSRAAGARPVRAGRRSPAARRCRSMPWASHTRWMCASRSATVIRGVGIAGTLPGRSAVGTRLPAQRHGGRRVAAAGRRPRPRRPQAGVPAGRPERRRRARHRRSTPVISASSRPAAATANATSASGITASTVSGAGETLTTATAQAAMTAAIERIRPADASPRGAPGARPAASVASGVTRKASTDTVSAAAIPAAATSTPATIAHGAGAPAGGDAERERREREQERADAEDADEPERRARTRRPSRPRTTRQLDRCARRFAPAVVWHSACPSTRPEPATSASSSATCRRGRRTRSPTCPACASATRR